MLRLINPIFFASFFFIFGIRLILISLYGADFPVWDSWSEVRDLFIPWLKGTLGISDFFAAHNEHRLVLTRLLNLSMFLLNGGMSPKLVMGVQSALSALSGALLVTIFIGRKFSYAKYLLSLVIVAGFVNLIGYENMLWEFQSQFYFLILFSILTLWSALNLKPDYTSIVKLIVSVFFLCLSMSSAFVAVAVSGALFVYRGIFGKRNRKFFIIMGAMFLVLAPLLFKLLIRHVPQHDALRAKDLSSFMTSLYYNLGWPNSLFNGVGLIWIVLGLLSLIHIVFIHKKFTRNSLFGALLFCWSIIMQLAMAFNRGSDGTLPASRYSDCIVIALIGCCFLFGSILERVKYKNVLTFIFLVISLSSLWSGSAKVVPEIEKEKEIKLQIQDYARNALLIEQNEKGKGEALIRKGIPLVTVPYPSPDLYWETIQDLPRKYLPTGMKPYLIPTDARYGPNRPLENRSGLVSAEAESETGYLVGSYIGGDRWKGAITFGTIPISTRHLKIYLAGYLDPGKLGLKIVSLPGNETQIINEGSPPNGRGELMWPLSISLPRGSTAVEVSIIDRSTDMYGWLAFGGIKEQHRLSWISDNLGSVGVLFILLSLICVGTGCRRGGVIGDVKFCPDGKIMY